MMKVERGIHAFLCFSMLFLTVPLFLDLAELSFSLIKNPFPLILAPVPLGLFVVIGFFSSCYLSCFFFPGKYQKLIPSGSFLGLLLASLFFVFLWLFFISGASLIRIIQLVLPVFLLALIAFPKDKSDISRLALFFLTGFFFFVFLHCVDVLSKKNFSEVDEFSFSLFFGYGIYQAYVSYPGVVYQVFILAFGMSVVEKRIPYKLFFTIILAFCMIEVSLAARRASLIEFSLFFILYFGFVSIRFFTLMRLPKEAFTLIVSAMIGILVFCFDAPIFQRAFSSIHRESFDSGRIKIIENAFNVLGDDLLLLFTGHGNRSGFHNLFLDYIYSFGLIPIIIFLGILSAISFWLYKKANENNFFITLRGKVLLLCSFSGVFVQSMVNASITQPYYLINFIIVFIFTIKLFSSKYEQCYVQ